jgi:hypothetical protein
MHITLYLVIVGHLENLIVDKNETRAFRKKYTRPQLPML